MSSTPFTLSRILFSPALYTNIQKLWFRDISPTTRVPPQEEMMRWFGLGPPEPSGASFDDLCTEHFAPVLESINPKSYSLPSTPTYASEVAASASIAAPFLADIQREDMAETAANAMSLLLLLDQMPRNIYRAQQGVIYTHFDIISRSVLRGILGCPSDARLDLHPSIRLLPCRRMWFYMPLMHSEHKDDHDIYWKAMSEAQAELKADGDEESVGFVQHSLDSEKKHVALIDRFGRYPHRNVHLGRETTKEETKFLEAGGDDFGTGKKKG